jgi:glycosyltransferase involved in cell wall biosynthesis
MALVVETFLFVFCLACALPRMLWAALLDMQTKRGKPLAAGEDDKRAGFDVICISHVEWRHVWQRNQHVMSRLARGGRVLYCYPVKIRALRKHWRRVLQGVQKLDGPSLWLAYPLVIPGSRVSRAVERLNTFLIGGWLRARARRLGLANPGLWYYFPDLVSLRGRMGEICCVYDIQDDYPRFFWASPDVGAREQRLLAAADLVFTGAHSLYRKHRAAAKRIEFVPSGVDVEHFRRARSAPLEQPVSLRAMSGPVLGYFGLIDERIDLKLIAELARRRPNWNFVMVGPVMASAQRIEPLPNVRFPGQVDYEELPRYAQLFDVCLMPFVLNDLTRAINPTKTLEYFALERPVVSSRIPDIVEFYGEVIDFAEGTEEWEAAIERALRPDPVRIGRALAIARERSWDAITQRFADRIRDRIAETRRGDTTESHRDRR